MDTRKFKGCAALVLFSAVGLTMYGCGSDAANSSNQPIDASSSSVAVADTTLIYTDPATGTNYYSTPDGVFSVTVNGDTALVASESSASAGVSSASEEVSSASEGVSSGVVAVSSSAVVVGSSSSVPTGCYTDDVGFYCYVNGVKTYYSYSSSSGVATSSATGTSSAVVVNSSSAWWIVSSSSATATSSAAVSSSATVTSSATVSSSAEAASSTGTCAAIDPTITFASSGVTVTDNNGGVSVSGSVVTITCAGNYYLTGTSTNGQVLVNADTSANVYLYLNGVTLSNSSSAPIIGIEAERLFLNAVSGTTNSFTDASTRSGSDFTKGATPDTSKGAIYAKTDLTLMGSGSITVNGKYNNGIHSTKDIRFKESPTVTVVAVNNGIKGNNSINVEDYTGTTTITTTNGDGMHVEDSTDTDKGFISITGGVFTIKSGRDGLQAYRSVAISGGTFNITTGTGVPDETSSDQSGQGGQGGGMWGGSTTSSSSSSDTVSYKGIKSDLSITISGGTFTINSTEDAIHSNHVATVSGTAYITAAGRNGAHADDTLNLNGGTFLVTNSYEGFEATVINFNGGYTSVYATDDGWNGSSGDQGVGYIYVTGGTHVVYAGGDGLDCNGDFYMKGGTVFAQQNNTGGNGILDVGDGNYKFYYQGGTLIGVGTSNMSISSQISGTYSGYKTLNASAGATVTVSNGSTVLAAMKLSSKTAASTGLYMINNSSSYTMSVASYSGTMTADPGATGISYYDGTGNGN